MATRKKNRPRYPLYIVSKGRWETRHTAKALGQMGVPFNIVVEPQEVEVYERVIEPLGGRVIPLDMSYKDAYETLDPVGDEVGKGPGAGAARNFVWQHSMDEGYDRHWVMDDNIQGFFRFNKNLKTKCTSGAFWRAMEDFTLRYENVVMAGPQYVMFVPRKNGHMIPPFVINTRIYSCNFIQNDLPLRWRCRYNEDTDLSLRILKAGHCTIQFNAFLQFKLPTQTVKGGNTDEIYFAAGKGEEGKDHGKRYAPMGTLAKSQQLVRLHPDVARLVWKFGRWHHYVNYEVFKNNLPRKRKNTKHKKGTDNYGMSLHVDETMPKKYGDK